jgi:CHAD domain-containing protein
MAKVRFGQQLNNPSPTCEEVVRLILAQEVAGLVHYSPRAYQGHDPEAVHQLRVKARRLRSELEIVAPVVKKKAQRRMDEELRWAGKVLGRERDLDVLFELLSSLSDEPSHSLDASVLADIDEQRTKESRRIKKMIRSERYRRLVHSLTVSVIEPPLRQNASSPASELLHPGLDRTLSSLFRAVDHYGPAPTNDELHEIRILSKRARYCAEVASTYLGPQATHLASVLAKAQGVLGQIHDQVGAISYLSTQRMLLDRDCTFVASSESPSAAIEWLSDSVEDLKRQWRAPLSEARRLSAELKRQPVKVRSIFETLEEAMTRRHGPFVTSR